jgi:hypothetical protein
METTWHAEDCLMVAISSGSAKSLDIGSFTGTEGFKNSGFELGSE